jgi:hypothetical protein
VFSLGVIAMAWLTFTFIPSLLLMKSSFFAVEAMFFGLMPVSYRYPKYRRFTSPFIWTFWKVPTYGALIAQPANLFPFLQAD